MTARLDWQEIFTIERSIPHIIDGSWHFSWHWEYDKNGLLTVKGWEQALEDGERLERDLLVKLSAVQGAIADIKRVIAQKRIDDEAGR